MLNRKASPATPNQLTAINQLELKLKDLEYEIIQPVTTIGIILTSYVTITCIANSETTLAFIKEIRQLYQEDEANTIKSDLLHAHIERLGAMKGLYEYLSVIRSVVTTSTLEALTKRFNNDPLAILHARAAYLDSLMTQAKELIVPRENFLALLNNLGQFSENPTVLQYFSGTIKPWLSNGVLVSYLKLNQDLLANHNFASLAKLIGMAYHEIKDRPSITAEDEKTIALFSTRTARITVARLISLSVALVTTFLERTLINPLLQRIAHCWYNKNSSSLTRQTTFLSEARAEEYLKSLRIRIHHNKKTAQQCTMINRLIMTICLPIIMYSIVSDVPLEMELSALLVSTAFSLMNEMRKWMYKQYQDKNSQKKFIEIKSKLKKMISDTSITFTTNKDEFSHDIYVDFTAKNYATLSSNHVMQVFKDVLLKNGIDIIAYEKNHLTIVGNQFIKHPITKIRNEMNLTLARLINIKKLSVQLNKMFEQFTIVKKINLQDGLPSAVFYISDADKVALETIQNLYPMCDVTRTESILIISGFEPATQSDWQAQLKRNTQYLVSKNEIHARENKASSSASHSEPAAKIKARKQASSTSQITPEETDQLREPAEVIRFPSGVFGNNDSPIVRMEHPLFRRNHFILFRVPREAFPDETTYQRTKNKVEESRLASSSVGQQGLQFRPELARDETKPRRPWFDSEMRGKFLGELGDVRVYAEHEVSGNNHLYVFKGVKLHAH